MAPAACDTIARNLQDFHRKPSDYDAIFTGDLGMVGQTILLDLLTEKGFDISSVHQDCGMLIYDPQTQDTHSGGSGCGCAASVLAGYILPGIIQKKWKRILFVPTGALLSKVSFNEGDPPRYRTRCCNRTVQGSGYDVDTEIFSGGKLHGLF